jgi:NAD(P) transhydrogenase subunit beta
MAMNRSFISVIASGFGVKALSAADEDLGDHREIDAAGTAELLADADSVIMPPATEWPSSGPSTASPS